MRPRNALTELYASELAYLQDAGRALALASPDDAAALLAQSDDPDVERLLEGVAFLTAGLRARIDQASAQISHGLAELLLPHFLRSLPAATIIEFSPDIRALRTRPRIARGRLLRARPIDGTVCRFRTCFDVDLWPLTVRDARLDHPSGQRPRLTLTLELADSGRALLSEPKPLRFFIHHASTALPATLLLWLTQKKHLHRVTVHSGGGPPVELPDAVTPLSADTSAVFPWPDTAPIGYRSVLELFALPQKFCFFDLHGLERAPLDASELVLTFEFHSPPPLNAAVGPDTFHLHCTPAINLFECPGQPITHSPLGRESIVRAEGFDPRHIEVHELLSVTATGRVEGGRAVIPPFTRRAGVPSEGRSYALRRAPSPADGNVDTYLTLVPPSDPGRTEQPPEHELLSLELLCTNRELAGELRRGDISENTPAAPFVRTPTYSTPPRPSASRSARRRYGACSRTSPSTSAAPPTPTPCAPCSASTTSTPSATLSAAPPTIARSTRSAASLARPSPASSAASPCAPSAPPSSSTSAIFQGSAPPISSDRSSTTCSAPSSPSTPPASSTSASSPPAKSSPGSSASASSRWSLPLKEQSSEHSLCKKQRNKRHRMTPSPPTTRTQAHTPQQRALLRQLESAPESAALVAAVEWLWRLFPEASDRPHDRRVQLRHSTDLAFDAREIASVEYDAAPPTAAVLTASFFGLAGAATMLPHYLAEEADADDDRAAAIRGLLDIIHHRLLTHLVRGLHAVDLARTLRADGADPWSRRILDFLGHDDSDTIPPALALRLAPALAAGVRTPALLTAALRILLENHLGAAHLHVEAFSGGWMPIDAPQWSTFGAPTARLGDTAVLGTEVFYPAGAARIVIGPLRGDEYRKFTPGHLPHARIAQFTRQFSPDPIQFDLILDIEDLALPPGILGQRSLGEDLWLARSDHRGVKDRKTIPLA